MNSESMGEVLIVDDSLTVRMNLLQMFEAAGIRAEASASLEEAKAALSKTRFALMILDVLLPDGDGIDFLRDIRGTPLGRDLVVRLLSTEGEVRDRVRGLTTGADEYIGKPYDSGYVVTRTRELLRRGERVVGKTQETVLVIDDSPTFRAALKEALESAAYHVLLAGTGEEGLHIAADLRPTAIVVD